MKNYELTTKEQIISQILYGDEGQLQDDFNVIASAISLAYNQHASEENIREALFETLNNNIKSTNHD